MFFLQWQDSNSYEKPVNSLKGEHLLEYLKANKHKAFAVSIYEWGKISSQSKENFKEVSVWDNDYGRRVVVIYTNHLAGNLLWAYGEMLCGLSRAAHKLKGIVWRRLQPLGFFYVSEYEAVQWRYLLSRKPKE